MMPKKDLFVVHHWAVNTEKMSPKKELETAQHISKEKYSYNAQLLRDGSIYQTNHSFVTVGHALNQKHPGGDDAFNQRGFGVAFSGDLTTQKLTEKQKYAFWALYSRVCSEMSTVLKIMFHREISYTACPGNIELYDFDRNKYGNKDTQRMTREDKFRLIKDKGWVPLRIIEEMGGVDIVSYDYWTKEPIVRLK
jgi:hypothetical protein